MPVTCIEESDAVVERCGIVQLLVFAEVLDFDLQVGLDAVQIVDLFVSVEPAHVAQHEHDDHWRQTNLAVVLSRTMLAPEDSSVIHFVLDDQELSVILVSTLRMVLFEL